jgi:glycosyltransferase involved in cell wall biosynthesis
MMRVLRIAQVAPLTESVPPAAYGGTERVVSYLTEELVAMGHRVTLFASGDSKTGARLISGSPHSLRTTKGQLHATPYALVQLEQVFSHAQDFDIIHFHTDCLHFPLSRRTKTPTVTTLHGRLDMPELVPLYEEFREMPLVSISDAQREPLAGAGWVATVHHGLPNKLYGLGPGKGGYLAFLGRMSPEKRPDLAIEIARRVGMELRMAAKVDAADAAFFHEKIEPVLSIPGISFLGEIDDKGKNELLRGASAMLFPIEWPEPFGMVLIEAMACGTPVVAMRRGSVPEVLENGVTGFVVDDLESAVSATRRAAELDRRRCRAEFEKRFTARLMAENYVEVYERLIQR